MGVAPGPSSVRESGEDPQPRQHAGGDPQDRAPRPAALRRRLADEKHGDLELVRRVPGHTTLAMALRYATIGGVVI